MAAFDWIAQQLVSLPGCRHEHGKVTLATADISGQNFSIATKLKRVKCGFAVMINDGLIAYATTGLTSGGKVTFTRVGSIETSEDTVQYILFGV